MAGQTKTMVRLTALLDPTGSFQFIECKIGIIQVYITNKKMNRWIYVYDIIAILFIFTTLYLRL